MILGVGAENQRTSSYAAFVVFSTNRVEHDETLLKLAGTGTGGGLKSIALHIARMKVTQQISTSLVGKTKGLSLIRRLRSADRY